MFGRFSGIEKRLCEVGPVWFVDRDAAQFAEWGIDYVKYDWLEQDLLTDAEQQAGVQPVRDERLKQAANGITQRTIRTFAHWTATSYSTSRPNTSPRRMPVQAHCVHGA